MNYYEMLENLHVVSNNKDRDDMNFWTQEVYSESEFALACLDVRLLLKEGICREVERDEEKNGK